MLKFFKKKPLDLSKYTFYKEGQVLIRNSVSMGERDKYFITGKEYTIQYDFHIGRQFENNEEFVNKRRYTFKRNGNSSGIYKVYSYFDLHKYFDTKESLRKKKMKSICG